MAEAALGDEMQLRNDPDQHRFVALIDGEIVGRAIYHRRGGRYLLVHTEVDDSAAGRGVASGLARFAVDTIRAEGVPVVPLCPFMARYLEKRADDAELIDRALLTTLDTPPDR